MIQKAYDLIIFQSHFQLVHSSNVGDHGSLRAYQHESFILDVETSCTQKKVNSSNNKYSSTSKGPPIVRSRKYYVGFINTLLGHTTKHM